MQKRSGQAHKQYDNMYCVCGIDVHLIREIENGREWRGWEGNQSLGSE